MRVLGRFWHGWVLLVLVFAVVWAGCGGGGSPGGGSSSNPGAVDPLDPVDSDPPESTDPDCETSFSGTYEAIQEVVFERHGCSAQACHGSAAAGGLDLSADVAHGNLLEVPSTGSTLPRIRAGDNDRSYLWLKLAAKTEPGSVEIGGAPMPVGDTALSSDELELVRRWIKAGAPASGTVGETQEFIDGCVPEVEPIIIRPLDPPPSAEGIQLVMPEYVLEAASETEICFAQYYDLTDVVPEEFQNSAGTHFRISESDLRQDPQSHHLILYGAPAGTAEEFGEFRCTGGDREGESCEPTALGACGAGACASEPVQGVACVGLGGREQLLVAQQSNEHQVFDPGVFAEIPLAGYWLWNSHAFNLTTKDTRMHARINYKYAKSAIRQVRRIFDGGLIFANATPPFGSETLCKDLTLPKAARLFNLIAHTHKRGKHFWVTAPDGTQIYESFVYDDPTNQYYEPALEFDSDDPAERTIRFCAHYENGLAPDGSMDPSSVRRRSVTPENSFGPCPAVACTAGMVGASCSGADDHAACDSSPGAGDGECDACVLRGGVSTEEEMFLLMGAYYVQ